LTDHVQKEDLLHGTKKDRSAIHESQTMMSNWIGQNLLF